MIHYAKNPFAAKMFVSLDRRLLYGLLVPSSFIIIGGIIWYHNRRKSRKNDLSFCIQIFLFYLDEQIRLNRSEYLVLEVQVPNYCVGSIIGKGGEAIKRVRKNQYKIKTNINISFFVFN